MGETIEGTHGQVYKFNASVNAACVFDQVHVHLFFAYCVGIEVGLKTNC